VTDQFSFIFVDAHALFPVEVDDEYITETSTGKQPSSRFSLVTGMNELSRIFACAVPIIFHQASTFLSTMEESSSTSLVLGKCDCGRNIKLQDRISSLKALLVHVKEIGNKLPKELHIGYDPTSMDQPINDTSNTAHAAAESYFRKLETIRANVQVTRLWIQHLLFERVTLLMETLPDLDYVSEPNPWAIREKTCCDLLQILHNLDLEYLKPLSVSLVCSHLREKERKKE
jgi:hypothetical protein